MKTVKDLKHSNNMKNFNVLVIVDAQNDFITGSLANPVANERVPNIVDLIENRDWDLIVTTFDTHFADYLDTMEGEKLPVPHCILGTSGHNLDKRITDALYQINPDATNILEVNKATFGSIELSDDIFDTLELTPGDELNIVMCGFCTDICVVSNALLLKANFPNIANITVVSNACAGVTPESHEAALSVMRSCQINVI